jgi:hypothetical protein
MSLGDVPGRVAAHAEWLAGPDGAAAACVLEEELGTLGLVHVQIEILRVALRHPCVAASLVGDAGAPDLGRLDRQRELVALELVRRLGRSLDDPGCCPVAEREHQ